MSAEQLLNAPKPRFVAESGIFTDTRAPSPMSVAELPNITEENTNFVDNRYPLHNDDRGEGVTIVESIAPDGNNTVRNGYRADGVLVRTGF